MSTCILYEKIVKKREVNTINAHMSIQSCNNMGEATTAEERQPESLCRGRTVFPRGFLRIFPEDYACILRSPLI